ncbi:MAG: UDP-glucose/GDP-mannose dehydrogenase family protein [Sedimentisphaerales bacterium]|nr:UDP-glucose/GDP-mannose dehydrogenase family protein [Sedimentisphaerales bacterium]
MELSVVGLGKLGLCTAAYFASKGHKVIGFDKNAHRVGELEQKRCPIRETGLEMLLETAWDRFSVTMDLAEAVHRSDITLIIVPTPSGADGRFSNEYVEAVLRGIGPALASKDGFHVVDVVSTVMPGSSENVFIPLLEELSGKVCGEDFGLVYNPEFIALGSVIEDFARPDMVLIGASDERSGGMVERLYLSSCENEPHIAKMSLVNAEIAKLSLNCFVTMKISFANELASICEKVPGADVDAITEAIGQDSRIGGKCVKAGLGFGGPCFPRDNVAFQAFARGAGIEARLGPQVVAVNESVVGRLFEIVRQKADGGAKVALLGLSYKPGTHIVEESQSVILAEKLRDAGYKVAVHDPLALRSAKEVLGESVVYDQDVYSCAKDAGAVVLMTDWPEYSRLDWRRIESLVKDGALLLDSWRALKKVTFNGLRYTGLGIGAEASQELLHSAIA